MSDSPAPSEEPGPVQDAALPIEDGAVAETPPPAADAARESAERAAPDRASPDSTPPDSTPPDRAPSDAWAAADAAAKEEAEAAPAPAGEPEDASAVPAASEAGEHAGEPAAEHEEEAPAPRPATERGRSKLAEDARAKALPRLASLFARDAKDRAEVVVSLLERGYLPAFLGRYRREQTGGLDERSLLEIRDTWRKIRAEEERRGALHDLLAARGALTPELAARLEDARDVPAMEDLAAPWLPVTASRATVARGHGLQGLADAIRAAKEPGPLSDLAKPFVKEGSEVTTLDAALAGARDILAEEACLDPVLRGRLREAFRRQGIVTVSLRNDRKGDAGRHASLVGFSAPANKVPPLKMLAIRRGERDRVLQSTLEPSEERALSLVHDSVTHAIGTSHPHGGFLRAAAEDGYRRILRPLLQAEIRTEWKARADEAAIDTFDRSYRNLLLGPVGGPKKTLGVQPDVTGGHRVGAVDEAGRTVHFGRLPHEATTGREAAVLAAKELVEAHAIEAVAIGTSNGRREALSIFAEALKEFPRFVIVTEVNDGGTRALEAHAIGHPVKTEVGIEVAPEFVGALSLARRFQDPMSEYARIDPRHLGLGPNLPDVHQGRLREVLEDAFASCVAHTGVEATTADVDLLARVPGLDRGKAKAFVAWRSAGGTLSGKAALAAVEGVGHAAAEQAVGFLRVANAADPRDRTQLHPEQFGFIDAMAEQLSADVTQLFADPRLRSRIDLGRLASAERPLPALRYAFHQLTTGLVDPRPRHAVPVRPPADVRLETIRPGLLLEGRVTRAVPFGVFVDVGLGAEALVPLPHIGDRPGVDPATIAPVGAVVNGRVLEVDVAKRRLTLSMRSDLDERRDGPPRGRRPMGPPRGGRDGDRRDGPPRGAGAGGGMQTGAPVGAGMGQGQGPDRGPRGAGGGGGGGGGRAPGRFEGRGERRDGPPSGAGAKGRGSGGPPSRISGPPRVGGGLGGMGRGGKRDGDRRFERDDPGAPRRISLPMDAAEPAAPDAGADESLSPEQLMAKKLEELKKRLARPE